MSALSILNEEGIPIGCANPIYLTSDIDLRSGANITFEVLEADASYLKRLVRTTETFGIDPKQGLFLAELTALEPCTSTVPALALLREKPAMRGVLTIHEPVNVGASKRQA